ATKITNQINYPITLKLHSPNITHKSNIQNIILYLHNTTKIKQTTNTIFNHIHKTHPQTHINNLLIQNITNHTNTQKLQIIIKHNPL
ncbi:hypothetical protein DF186_18870, partial [Enterococcus hirae]